MNETYPRTVGSFASSISQPQTENAGKIDFEELFSKHSPALYRMALRKVGNPQDAEDAVQEGLLSAYRHFNQFKGDSQISTWLTSIVLNAARMQLRRRSNRILVPLDTCNDDRGFAMPDILAETKPDPEEIFRSAQVREVLERYVANLSPKIRLVFRLCVLEGLTTREAAERLGICQGTLKARLSRGRMRITRLMRGALVSPAKSRKHLNSGRAREFDPQDVAISRKCSLRRHAA